MKMKWFVAGSVLLMSSISGLMAEEDIGTFSLDTRTRFETAEQDGKLDSENFSIRLRPGYTTPDFNGLKAMVEGEFTGVLDEDKYNAAGVHGNGDRTAIADPENAQLEQLWVGYDHDVYGGKVGRQVLALDNQRWVGHVGWRQNRQTFDAATVNFTPAENLNVFYGYVDNVVRIFGDEAPSSGGNAEEFGSESHLVNVFYGLGDLGKVTGYGYFVDLEDAPGKIAGSDTIGLSYSASCSAIEQLPLGVYLEYANQSDAGDNVQDYSADYFHGSVNAKVEGLMLEAGYELLGSDAAGLDDEGNQTYASVKAPLATLHKFNGFADVFLVTPDKGLEDVYVMAGYTCDLGETVGPLTAKVWYHDFSSDEGGDDLGEEFDALLVKPIKIEGLPGKMSLLAKYADYQAPSEGSDVTRFSVELNYGLSF